MQDKQPIIQGGIILWLCPTCNRRLPEDAYYADGRTPNGLKAQCKKCHTATSMRTRDQELHRRTRRESAARVRAANPERCKEKERRRPRRKGIKVTSRQIVNLAVRIGAIVRPDRCEQCGEQKKLTAHHKDYLKPLDINWLCYLCHAQMHRKNK